MVDHLDDPLGLPPFREEPPHGLEGCVEHFPRQMSKFEIGEAETITRKHAELRNQVNSENKKKTL
jgi:hypothetical protein